MFIAAERKKSSVEGTGIQYIPGHIEKFVDLIVDTYITEAQSIVDLGGGGLRFAIPAALRGKKVTVVDLDKDGLDVGLIAERVNENKKMNLDKKLLQERIQTYHQSALDFLRETKSTFDCMTAYRLLHFFSPTDVDLFFKSAHSKLNENGILVFSAMTFHNLPYGIEYNDVYTHSSAVKNDNPYYRRFLDDTTAQKIRAEQNLQSQFHCFDHETVRKLAHSFGYDILLSGFPSTKIVAGFILKKRS